jgi:hypothetical protein
MGFRKFSEDERNTILTALAWKGGSISRQSSCSGMSTGSRLTRPPSGDGEIVSTWIATKRSAIKLKEPFECRAVGTGFMLIRLDAIKDLPRPWFALGTDEQNEVIGEDVHFCDAAREHGIEVWCDPRIPVGHIGDYTY